VVSGIDRTSLKNLFAVLIAITQNPPPLHQPKNTITGSYPGGNYWGDYAGNDTGGDGLGDTLLPYNSSGDIQNGGDLHPLTAPAAPPATFTPPDPINFQNTTGEYWVNYTWSPGIGNVTGGGGCDIGAWQEVRQECGCGQAAITLASSIIGFVSRLTDRQTTTIVISII